jgi:hypothetical protein
MSVEKITLANLSPDLNHQFDVAQKQIMANIDDDNYPIGRKRYMIITLEYNPDSAREVTDVTPKVKIKIPDEIKLASTKVYKDTAGDGSSKEGVVSHHPNQIDADLK